MIFPVFLYGRFFFLFFFPNKKRKIFEGSLGGIECLGFSSNDSGIWVLGCEPWKPRLGERLTISMVQWRQI